MRIIIGDGKVAQRIRSAGDVVLSHSMIEVRDDPATLARTLEEACHDRDQMPVVVNTAAKINLEDCERNKDDCYAVNTRGAINVALACESLGYKLVHISSGCVFDGMGTGKSYTEEDEPTPASYYAFSKAEADRKLMEANLSVPLLILRPRQLVSAVPHKTNMLTRFLSVGSHGRFIESPNSITCLEEFSKMVAHLIKINVVGIFNCANKGFISPYQIALKLKKIDPQFDPQPIDYQDYLNSIEVKRVNTCLSTNKLESTGFFPRTAEEAIDECVRNYGKETIDSSS